MNGELTALPAARGGAAGSCAPRDDDMARGDAAGSRARGARRRRARRGAGGGRERTRRRRRHEAAALEPLPPRDAHVADARAAPQRHEAANGHGEREEGGADVLAGRVDDVLVCRLRVVGRA